MDSATFSITIGDVHSKAPGQNPVVALADAQAKKLGEILCNIKAETAVHTKTETVGERK